METYLIDTTVLVEHLRGNRHAKRFLEKFPVFVSHVSVAELIQGTPNKLHLKTIARFLHDLALLPLNQAISVKALGLMKQFFHSHRLEYLDALIAATALQEHLSFVTANMKHFYFIPGLSVIDWKKMEEVYHD